MTRVHRYSVTQNAFTALKPRCAPLFIPPSPTFYILLGWAKRSFGFFHQMLWENLKAAIYGVAQSRTRLSDFT